MKICSIADCEKKVRVKGLCAKHHEDQAPPCTMEDCTTGQHSKGYCKKHYARLWKHGDPNRVIDAKERADLWNGKDKPKPKVCSVQACHRTDRIVHGLCHKHYATLQRRGTATPNSLAEEERFWSYVVKDETTEDGCWNWTGSVVRTYPRFGHRGAHRVSYEWATKEAITNSEPVHHKCSNRLCVRPDHLQRVTAIENTAEMLERRYYKKRIAELEAEVAQLKASCECAA